MHKVHAFHRIYAKHKQFLMIFHPFSTRSINHFTSRVVVRMFVETKMLIIYFILKGLSNSVFCGICYILLQTQLQEQCFASKHERFILSRFRNGLLPLVDRAVCGYESLFCKIQGC